MADERDDIDEKRLSHGLPFIGTDDPIIHYRLHRKHHTYLEPASWKVVIELAFIYAFFISICKTFWIEYFGRPEFMSLVGG